MDKGKTGGDKKEFQKMTVPLLSILICHLNSRKYDLDCLVAHLNRQIEAWGPGEVDVLVNADDGGKTVGTKRQELLERATGKYIAFVDDDDRVSGNYVKEILEGCRQDVDCCSLVGIYYLDGKYQGYFHHSIEYRVWEKPKEGLYLRPPNHLNAVKRELALAAGFPDLAISEDHDYSMKLLPMLKTEHKIKDPIYKYMCRSGK